MAARFWVGGTGAWDNADTSHWSATTGGAGGASVPTSADDVTFDSNSGASATVTIQTATANANTITVNKSDLTLTHSGFGSTVVGAVTLTGGTLNTNGQTCSWGRIVTNGGANRTLTLGSSAISLSQIGSGTPALSFNATGLTITANTAIVTLIGGTGSGALSTCNFNGMSIVCNTAGDSFFSGAFTLNNFTRTGTAIKANLVRFSGNSTITGTMTIGGGSTQGVNRLLVSSDVVDIQRTITAAAYVITGDVDFMDINLAYSGAASWTNTGNAYIGDCLGNAGAVTTNATASTTQTATGTASFTWSTHGWTSRVPLPQDDVVINNAFVAGQTITADMPRIGRDINFTGVSGGPTLSIGTNCSLFGSLTLSSGMASTVTGGSILSYCGRSSHTITNTGIAFAGGPILSAPGGTYTLQDAYNSSAGSGWQILSGAFISNNQTITCQVFTVSSGATATLGTSVLTIATTSNALPVSISAGATFSGASATFILSGAVAITRTFGGGGKTFGTLTYTVANSPGALAITGANTFNTLNVGSGRVLTMPSATTNTITNFNVNGAVNGYVYLPGVVGHWASTPDAAALDITGDITIDARIAPDNWAVTQVIVAKADQGQQSYQLVLVAGKVVLDLYATLGGGNIRATSSAVTGFLDGAVGWIRAAWRQSDGRVQFFTSNDGTAWAQLGTDQSIAIASIYSSTAILEIGNKTSGTGTAIFKGKMYQVRLYSDITQTTKVFDADFTTKAVGANTFTESSSNAATVTINGNLARAGDGRILAASSTPGTKWFVNTAAASASYVDVQDSTASGAGSPIDDATGGVDRGNNVGWLFVAGGPAGYSSTMISMGVG